MVIAIILFVFLHRRHVRKLRREDAIDKNNALDFGLDSADGDFSKAGKARKKKGTPEMTTAQFSSPEEHGLHGRGLSIDVGIPYLLPPGTQGSTESLHSLSRTMHNGDDPYRPATMFVPNDQSASHSYPSSLRPARDDSSSWSGSHAGLHEPMSQDLIRNAAAMSRTTPPAPRIASPGPRDDSAFPIQVPEPTDGTARKGSATLRSETGVSSRMVKGVNQRDSYIDRDGGGMRKSNNYLAAMITASETSATGMVDRKGQASPGVSSAQSPNLDHLGDVRSSEPLSNDPALSQYTTGRRAMIAPVISLPEGLDDDETAHYAGQSEAHSIPPRSTSKQPFDEMPSPPSDPSQLSANRPPRGELNAPAVRPEAQRRSMGLRPLPPNNPSDDPEQRANRIRSFYKEYFDETKPLAARQPQAYYEDYGTEYLQDATRYASVTEDLGRARAPFAQPIGRRAMTPPPRAPPHFRAGSSKPPSAGSFTPRASRAFSSASGGFGPGGPTRIRGASGRPAPPPEPLRILPTPHLLKEDDFVLPIDFAPPSTYRDRQAGRPESPLGGMRPYSPATPVHLPLASSFDDLSVMPSP